MLIYPVTPINNKTNNCSFKSKNLNIEHILHSANIKEQLNNIKTNADAKNIFMGLSVLAGSILAELTALSDKAPEIKDFADKILNKLGFKDDKKLKEEMNDLFSSILNHHSNAEKTDDYTPMLEENPKRNNYLSILADYPNLNEKYTQMLIKAIKSPDDIQNKFTLETLEVAFEMMSKDDKLPYYESYFETLEKKYSNKLDDLASTIITAYKNGISPISFLQMLHCQRIIPDEVTKWANAKNLEYDEFLKCKFLDSKILTNISNVKSKNNNFRISSMRPFDNYKVPLYTFKIKFKEGIPLEEKLKIVADVHTAIYGQISLNDEPDVINQYMNSDIRTELTDNILKDKGLDSVFRFVRYINPEALKDINLTGSKVRFLPRDSEIYKKIKDICSKEIFSLNPENPKLFELYEVMQDKNIFGDLFTTNHSKIRFITRFVLKGNPTPQSLLYRCKAKVQTLRKELDLNLKNFNFICFANKKGFAPQFYNFDSKLGNCVKITLNSSGNIHTIYEDISREIKYRQNKEQEEKNAGI